MTEVLLRLANGADVGTVDVDDVPADAALLVGGKLYVRSQRNENQWREMPVVKVAGAAVEPAEPVVVPGTCRQLQRPRKKTPKADCGGRFAHVSDSYPF